MDPAENLLRESMAAWSAIPKAHTQEYRVPGGHNPRSEAPPYRQKPGGHRTAKTLQPLGGPEVSRSAVPATRASRHLQTESSIITAAADFRAGELTAATIVVPIGATQDKQCLLSFTGVSRDKQVKQLSRNLAPGRGLSSSPNANT